MKIYGIQGGRGSFNEAALFDYLQRRAITSYEIRYLYTTSRVLQSLQQGEIEQGQFAIENTLGGPVIESVEAMKQYPCTIIERFSMRIAHALMIRLDTDLQNVTTIMAHPQVFLQCKNTLARKYPHLRQVSGQDELADHAFVAEQLGKKLLPKEIAVMGSALLATINGLTIVDVGLQDSEDNETTFLAVIRQS